MKKILALCACLLLAGPAFAAYEWKIHLNDPGRWYLYQDGRQVGGYDPHTGNFRPFDGENWGAIGEPPVNPPGTIIRKIKQACPGNACPANPANPPRPVQPVPPAAPPAAPPMPADPLPSPAPLPVGPPLPSSSLPPASVPVPASTSTAIEPTPPSRWVSCAALAALGASVSGAVIRVVAARKGGVA